MQAMNLTLLPTLLLATPSAIPPIHIDAALSGRPSYFDSLLFCLGMQTPQSPTSLNKGEYPACAAMTTGYVFRVENQATVMYLQRVGRTGHLVTLDVTSGGIRSPLRPLAYLPAILLAGGLRLAPLDWYVKIAILFLLLSRILSIASLRAKTVPSWHGAPEPGVKGDLLILLSEDRWIRIKGLVDDLKAVTSGSWLNQPEYPQLVEAMDWMARLLVYIAVVVLGNAEDSAKIALILSALLGHGIVALSNSRANELVMNKRRLKISEEPGSIKKYSRRLEMAEELIKEMGRSDFAVRLGMINREQVKTSSSTTNGESVADEAVTM